MKRLLASILILPMLVLPVQAETIKWVDFNVSYESMKYALDQDIATFEQEKHISWIDILALAAVQIRAVGKNVAVFVEFLHVAGKELRQKLLADILVGNQGLVQRVGGKALVQQCLKLWQVFFCNFV